MAVSKKKRVSAQKSNIRKKHTSQSKSTPTKNQQILKKLQKIDADTAMDLTSKFMCEEHPFPELTGLDAVKMIYIVQALIYINLTEMYKEIRQKIKK